MKISRLVLGALLICSLACSFVQGRYQSVAVHVNTGAKIKVDGQPVGSAGDGAPLVTKMKRSDAHYVTATADGHRSQTMKVDSSLSTLGIIDVAAGFLLFFIPWVTLLTGHAYALEPDQLYFELEEREGGKVAPPADFPSAPPEVEPAPQ